MKRFLPLFYIVLLAALAGCDEERLVKFITPPEDEATAKKYIELLRQDRFDELRKVSDPEINAKLDHDTFEQLRAAIPEGDPVSVKVVGCYRGFESGYHYVDINFEYQFAEKPVLIDVDLRKDAGVPAIIGLHVQPLEGSLEAANRFTLSDKGAAQYVMLALACAVPLFTITALAACCADKTRKRKWLWIIFIIFGVGKLTVNWTTGQLYLTPLAIQLFGFAAVAAPYSPWMISVSLPLGAIVFLVGWGDKNWRIIERPQPPPVKPEPPGKEGAPESDPGKKNGPYDY